MTALCTHVNRIYDLAEDIEEKGEDGIARSLRYVAWMFHNRVEAPE